MAWKYFYFSWNPFRTGFFADSQKLEVKNIWQGSTTAYLCHPIQNSWSSNDGTAHKEMFGSDQFFSEM